MTRTKTIYWWVLGFIFALAISLRIIVFSYRDSFEDDECRLLSAFLNKSWWQMFFALGDAQSAPPLFIIFERIWGNIWGFGAKSLKLIPLVSSMISLFLFYKLSLIFLKQKPMILIANLLFAVNMKLLFFSSVIKQYSNDVLVSLICCLTLYRLNIMKLSKKGLFLLSLILSILPLVSLPSLFFIGAFFLVNLFNNLKNKGFYLRILALSLPLLMTFILYYFYNLLPSKVSLEEYFPNYWDIGLIGFSWLNFVKAQAMLFRYLFYPNIYYLMAIVLFYFGIYFVYKDKKQIYKYVLAVLSFVLSASILKLYPIEGRVALYLVPFLILLFLKPLDKFSLKNPVFYLFLLIFFVAFGKYNYSFPKEILKEASYINYSPKILMQTLIKNYNSNTDVVLCNSTSSASYIFYSSYFNFNNNEIYEIPLYGEMSQDEILRVLNSFKSGQNYWLYLIKDYSANEKIPTILKWAMDNKILFEQKDRDSYLILFKKLK